MSAEVAILSHTSGEDFDQPRAYGFGLDLSKPDQESIEDSAEVVT